MGHLGFYVPQEGKHYCLLLMKKAFSNVSTPANFLRYTKEATACVSILFNLLVTVVPSKGTLLRTVLFCNH